jgi:hypothetical protein
VQLDGHICGLAWCVVYVLVLWNGRRDRSYGVPIPALTMNLAWELFDAFIARRSQMKGYSLAWLVLDAFILLQTASHLEHEHPKVRKRTLLLGVGLGVLTWLAVLVAAERYGLWLLNSAFLQNLVMSLLFLRLLIARGCIRGQSLYIATFKLVGTGSVVVALLREAGPSAFSRLIPALAPILLADVLYIALYTKYALRQGTNPPTRL